jgi:hypothetical protein
LQIRRTTGSPRIGYNDKALSRRSSWVEEDEDEDGDWTAYIDRDEPRFYVSSHAVGTSKHFPCPTCLLCTRTTLALPSFLTAFVSFSQPLYPQPTSPPKLATQRTSRSNPDSARRVIMRGALDARLAAAPLPPFTATSSSTSNMIQPQPTLATAHSEFADKPIRQPTTTQSHRGSVSSVPPSGSHLRSVLSAGSSPAINGHGTIRRAPPPLSVHIPLSGRQTPDELSPLPSPMMSPTVVRAAQALAVLPDAARMSPLRSPLAALYQRPVQHVGRRASPLMHQQHQLAMSETPEPDEASLNRSWGSAHRTVYGVRRGRRPSQSRPSSAVDDGRCRKVRQEADRD